MKTWVEVRVRNGKDEVTGEIIKGGSDRVVDWILRLYKMTFESCIVLEDLESGFNDCGGQGSHAHVILVLHEFI